MRGIEASLNEVLALGLGDEWLEFGGGEGIYKASLGHDEKQDLSACECG